MRQISLFLLAALPAMMLSCESKEIDPKQTDGPDTLTEITASFSSSDSKTVLSNDMKNVLWAPGDGLNVFYKGEAAEFRTGISEPERVATFVPDTDLEWVLLSDEYIYAAYPYDKDNTCADGLFTLNIKDTIAAFPGSFAPGSFPAIGRSYLPEMEFYSVCGGVCFSVCQEGITSVVFKSNDKDTLAGKAEVVFDENGIPAVQNVSEPKDSIILCAPEGETLTLGKWYYIVALPGALEKGFTMKFYTADQCLTLIYSNSVAIKSSIFENLPEVDKGLEYNKKTYYVYNAINDTPTPHTLIPVKAGTPYQNLSMANALKAFGFDDKSSDAYKLFAAAKYHPSFTQSSSYYFTDDDQFTQVVSGLITSMADLWDRNYLRVWLDPEYAYDVEGIKVEGHTVYTDVTFKPENKQYSSVEYVVRNIPVSFKEPNYENFYQWNKNIELYTDGTANKSVDLNDYFTSDFCKGLVLKSEGTNIIRSFVRGTTKNGDGTITDTTNDAWLADPETFKWPDWIQNALVESGTNNVVGFTTRDNHLTDWLAGKPIFVVKKNATKTYYVTGLQTVIIGRTITLSDAVVNVISTTAN